MFNENWKLVWVLQLKSKHTLILFMFKQVKRIKKYLFFVNIFFYISIHVLQGTVCIKVTLWF